MELLYESAQQIATQSSDVLGNAERAVHGSQQIGTRIDQLNMHAEKVGEVLATIMSIADRADLLALNASLEGTKAGDVGKGFILVAAEMRRLAENVMASATEIRALMKEMRQASQAAVDASQGGIHSSDATTGSAREIARLTQQQRQSTEQVIASMTEMQEVLRVNVEAVQRSTLSAHSLMQLAQALLVTVDPNHPKARTKDSPTARRG
jgi:methyl-accepting chemotaxis protein